MKNLLCLGLSLCALFVFAVVGEAAPTKSKVKKHHHTVHGVIEEVTGDKDQNAGHIVVKTEHKGKKGTKAVSSVDKKFHITSSTKIELGSGKKSTATQSTGSFKDLKKGEHVALKLEGHKVMEVKIHKHTKQTTQAKKPTKKLKK